MIFVVAPMVAQACRNPYQDATIIQPAPPVYPDSARALGLGVVSAKDKVTLSPTGSVIGVSIAQSTGNMALDQAALMAARQSTYSPKIVNCEPVVDEYMFSVTFDPKRSSLLSLARMPGATPPSPPSPYPSPSPEEACINAVVGARWGFDAGRQLRDYDRALQSAAQAATMQAGCAAKIKSPLRFSLEMLAGSTLSRAADLAFQLGRYQQARTFATQANSIYTQVLAPSPDQNYAGSVPPNAKAHVQANDDLLKRIAQQEKCAGEVAGSISSLVLSQMPSGSSVHAMGVVQNYAVAISFGPGGYAVRSFLLIKQKTWKILASEGGAFDLSTYRRNGVPSSIATKLAASVACQ